MKPEPGPAVYVTADKLIVHGDSYSGFAPNGECLACGKSGGLMDAPYGLPFNAPRGARDLRHGSACPVGAVLDKDGTWKAKHRNHK